jgi:hypothetical protein
MIRIEHVACFFSGIFLANTVPHFVNGISGNRFPTPFARPPGRGLSSPVVNVLWGLFNLVGGWLLFRIGKVAGGDDVAPLVFFAGVAAMSLVLSREFAKKHDR